MKKLTPKGVRSLLCLFLKQNLRIRRLIKIIYFATLCFYAYALQAQAPALKPLSIGDAVPDIAITNVYNYSDSVIRLSDLKGKLVILDFWSTWCSGCLDMFPKMHRLQKEFNDDIQIILVNTYEGDSLEKVRSLFARWELATGENVALPFSLLQSSLFDYFPYRFLPYYAWIDENGKVLATTTQTEVTGENIKKIIAGKDVALHITRDMMDFDRKKPLFANNNGGSAESLLYRSIFLPYHEGIGNSVGHDTDEGGRVKRFYAFNQVPSALLALAFPQEMDLPLNRRYYEGDSALKWKALLEDDDPYHGYTYEIISPSVEYTRMLQNIREDMVRFFGIVPHIETRKTDCLILKKSDRKIVPTQYKKPQIQYTSTDSQKYIRCMPVSFIVRVLNYFSPVPIVDESGVTELIDIALPDNLYDEKSLVSAVEKAGFTITASQRDMKVAVVTSNKH